MKNLIRLLFLFVSLQLQAQSYPVTNITISLPPNPDANTNNWSAGASMLAINASTRLVNGKIDARVQESKILVTIKKAGGKICGAYTSNSAPSSNFNAATKVWSGSNAVSLLGQGCVLQPGEYELTVQFFGSGVAGLVPLSEENRKPFSIRSQEVILYQPPTTISPANESKLTEADLKKPITFRWTPVLPRPQEPVTYKLRIWQVMQGQNGTQAMRSNQPIITKDVENLTQTVITNLLTGPCKPPYLCDFVWRVQALNKEEKPIGGNNGMSDASQFSATSCDVNLSLRLNSVTCVSSADQNAVYKICVSATYTSTNYNLTYLNSGSGFKAYHPTYTPSYTVNNINPPLQIQNNGSSTTVDYYFFATLISLCTRCILNT